VGRLKNKYEAISAPTLVKSEEHIGEPSLKKGQDPEIWITETEDLRIRLGSMGSSISENKFMIGILNYLILNYELQITIVERRVGDIEKSLRIEEIEEKRAFVMKG
jgi:hypothetical protein